MKIKRESTALYSLSQKQMDPVLLYINQSISLAVHQQGSQVMNDLSGKEDTFNAHKTAHSLATFRIYACMITPQRRVAVSAALNMARLVVSNLCRGKERCGHAAPFMHELPQPGRGRGQSHWRPCFCPTTRAGSLLKASRASWPASGPSTQGRFGELT